MNVVGLYASCMEEIGDAEYCSGVIDVVLQAASTRVFSYTRKGKPRYLLLLPKTIYAVLTIEPIGAVAIPAAYTTEVLMDESKRGVAVLLRAPNHVVKLIYEREKEKFTLKNASVSNLGLTALLNSPLT